VASAPRAACLNRSNRSSWWRHSWDSASLTAVSTRAPMAGGAWSDRIGRLPALAVALTMGAVAILAVALPLPNLVVLTGYLGTGLAYGAVSALVPAATADRVGAVAFPTVYGVVFTGWGCAGLLAPLAGGLILDHAERLTWAVTPLIGAAVAVVLLAQRAPGQP
jgi:MFS transporter, OFA family, oxalate/formate antiporter